MTRSQAAKRRADIGSDAAIVRREKSAAAARTSGMSKKCAMSARHWVRRAQRRSLNALSSNNVTARDQIGSGWSSSSTIRSARPARPSSVSGRPPRHQTSVGRLDKRSDATALLKNVGFRPWNATVFPATRAGGAELSPSEIRMPRTVPASPSDCSASAAAPSRSIGPTATTVATSARIAVAPLS